MKLATLVLFLFFLALACSSGRGDPLDPGGSLLSPGAGRANLAVTTSNQYEASQAFFDDIRDHYDKATSAITTYADTGVSVRIMGNHNGLALARIIDSNTAEAGANETLDVQLEYTNYYSDTGKLFYVGKLKLSGEWRIIGGVKTLYKFILNGPVDLSGDYACQISFESFQMALDPYGRVLNMKSAMEQVQKDGPTYSLPNSGTVVITSGSETIRFSPYLFDYAPR